MLRLFPITFVLQAFCLYHAYTKKVEQKWFWIILFLPFIGSCIYLYHHFYSRRNIEKVSEGIKSAVNTNYEVEKLEKAVQHSDNLVNKMQLADKYVDLDRLEDAREIYLSCLTNFNQDDVDLVKRLILVHYLLGEYEQVIQFASNIQHDPQFKNMEEKSYLAWSLHKTGRSEEARKVFDEMDVSFSNYTQRLDLVMFLKESNEDEAYEKLEEIQHEFQQMLPRERKDKRTIERQVNSMIAAYQQ